MATITPANLSYKDKDGDLGEVKSLTDTDVTLLNNALQDIEDLKLAYSPGFAKRDFSNITQAGKNAAVGWGMPDYTAGISIAMSTTYVATVDSFVVARASNTSMGSDSLVRIFFNDSNGDFLFNLANRYNMSGATSAASVTLPIPKGYSVTLDYISNGTCYIYPLKGAN